ncbi:MAG: hypothetical protein HY534_00905 [Chloroflexi bacterium]|nr:hypothetical protein [Chloroflexota bacterium]
MDWTQIPAARVKEIVSDANRFAEANWEPTSVSTEWIRSRSVEEQAVLRAVRDLQVNGPGVVTTEKAILMEAEPSAALFNLLSTYARELERWT